MPTIISKICLSFYLDRRYISYISLSKCCVSNLLTLSYHLDNLNICKILLEHQADINASTKGLQTPLHFAALSEDSCNILEMFLLNTNININVTNAAGDTPYDLAHRNGPQVQLFDLVHEGLKI